MELEKTTLVYTVGLDRTPAVQSALLLGKATGVLHITG